MRLTHLFTWLALSSILLACGDDATDAPSSGGAGGAGGGGLGGAGGGGLAGSGGGGLAGSGATGGIGPSGGGTGSTGGGGSGGSGGGAPLLDCGNNSTAVAGAYYVDVDNLSGDADDTNDGKLESEGGTGPWRTWNKLAAELDSNLFQVGDWIYLRAGTYVPTAVTEVQGGGAATLSNKITISGYPGETVTIDTSITGDGNLLLPLSGHGPVHHWGGNVRWQNLNLICDSGVFSVSSGAPGVQFACIKQTWSGNIVQGENSGVFKFQGADDLLVEGCDLEGSIGSNANVGTLYLQFITRGLVRNNIIRIQGPGQAIHVKKNAPVASVGDVVIENNLIVVYGNQHRAALHGGWSRFVIRNNVFAFDSPNAIAMRFGDSGGNKQTIGWENLIQHNTIYSPSGDAVTMIARHGIGTWPDSGEDNTLTNNLFMGGLSIFFYDSGPHGTVTDYNLYRPGNSGVSEYAVNYDLAGWQTQGGGDASSLQGAPIFANAPDLNDPKSFALDPSSPGYQAASNGADVGADTSVVGPSGL